MKKAKYEKMARRYLSDGPRYMLSTGIEKHDFSIPREKSQKMRDGREVRKGVNKTIPLTTQRNYSEYDISQ